MRKIRITNFFKVPDIDIHFGNKKWYVYLLKSIIISLLCIVLSIVVIYNLEDISTFVSSDKSSDFDISDIYNGIADHSDMRVASTAVTVVAVDECSREELLDVLEIISEYSPKAIGLDIFFRYAEEDSMRVINTLNHIPNLVLPCMIQPTPKGTYQHISYSFVEKHVRSQYGYVNLNASSTKDIIRDFTPRQTTADGDTLLQLATSVAKIAAPEYYQRLIHRDNPTEIIHYAAIDIPTLSTEEIFNGNDDYLSRYLTDRAILVGDINNINDMYMVPINGLVAGILIHAYALNTIMMDLYTDITPDWLNWLIALLVSIIFIFANIYAKEHWSHIGNLLMRILQIMIMISMIYIGAYWYKNHMQYIDFSQVVLMIGFSSLAGDIYDGILAVHLKVKHIIDQRKK